MSAYTLTPAAYAALKRQATICERALRQCNERRREPGGPDAVERRAVAEQAMQCVLNAERLFNEHGWPDDWARWQRLADDAQMLANTSW